MRTRNLVLVTTLAVGPFFQSLLFAQEHEQISEVEDQAVPEDMALPSRNHAEATAAKINGASNHRQLRRLVEQADLVFRGVAVDIHYELSEASGPDKTRIPFTFVTYRVDDVIHGNLTNDSVTLQFIGGLNEETMRYMGASNVPQFDIGDEDILFVQGNTESISPLVGGRRGRLRVVDGRVYTETGRALKLNPQGVLEIGARYALGEVATTTVQADRGEMVIRHRMGPDTLRGPSDAVTAGLMIDKIRELALHRESPPLFVNADPHAVLRAPDMKPAAAPEIKSKPLGIRSPRGRNDAEFERQGSELEEVGPQKKSEF